MQENPDSYSVSTNIENTSDFVPLDFDELELEGISKEDLNFFRKDQRCCFRWKFGFPFLVCRHSIMEVQGPSKTWGVGSSPTGDTIALVAGLREEPTV